MDIPPEIINPPAIVWQAEGITEKRPALEEGHLEKVCQEHGEKLRALVYHLPVVEERPGIIRELQEQQAVDMLNHGSLFETFSVPYNHWKYGLPRRIKIARANMGEIPFFGSIMKKADTMFISFNRMTYSESKAYASGIKRNMLARRSFTYWPGGTRARDGSAGDFTKGEATARVMLHTARRNNLALKVSPQALVQDSIIESPFYPIVDFFKSKYGTRWGKLGYIGTDLAAFGVRYLRNRVLIPEGGVLIHAFAEPFDIRECRNEHEVTQEAQKRVEALMKRYQPQADSWPQYTRLDDLGLAMEGITSFPPIIQISRAYQAVKSFFS